MKRLAIISFLSLSSLISQAPDAYALCDCDHLIATTEITVDGDALGVQPGDSVCLEPGAREALRLANFNGSEGAIIEVRNCEGVAHIENEERGYGITLDDSVHVRITGAGEPDIPYGIYVRAARTGPDYAAMGVAISGYNHDIEVDHLEVVDAGFAGFMVKSDPTCDNPDLSSHTQYNIELHHNYIRTPGGEGFYLGSTGYPSRTRTCDGTDIELYPHWHEGLHVHHNIVEDSAWDGLQVGVTPVDCSIHHNTIINPGLEEVQYQTRGFQFGALSSCDVHGNVLVGGTTIGIFILGAGDMRVYNNVIADFAEDAIYANQSEAAPQGTTYAFAHNTIVRPGGYGIQVFGGDLGPSVAINNIVAEAGEIAIGAGNNVAWTESRSFTRTISRSLAWSIPRPFTGTIPGAISRTVSWSKPQANSGTHRKSQAHIL